VTQALTFHAIEVGPGGLERGEGEGVLEVIAQRGDVVGV
jgi:hypothetical protein